jgi:hypothetical protein
LNYRAGWARRACAFIATAFALATAAPASAEIVADSGFRPQPDGFSFRNYGGGHAELNALEMQRIYGRGVCLTGKGAACVLRPGARTAMRAANRSMSGGHCYGFAVLSETVYKGLLPRFGFSSLAQLGAPNADSTTFEIPLEGNIKIQRAIARAWYFQQLPSVARTAVRGKPSKIIDKLREVLQPGEREGWTLGIIDFRYGGHQITPFALDDLGGGKYEILVYDNNWPDEERRVQVDTVAETWEYELAPGMVWEGDATTKTMHLHRVRPALGLQPCPFCVGRAGLRSKYNEITLDAPGVEHAHLILRDRKGRRTGYVDGKLVNEIPGVKVEPRATGVLRAAEEEDDPALVSAEPVYRVPRGKQVRITVDARHLERRELQMLTVVGPAFDAHTRKLVLNPGERAVLALDPKRERLRYTPAPATREAAVMFNGEVRDRKHPKNVRAAFEIEIAALGLPKGARVEFRKHLKYGVLQFGHAAKRRARVRYRVQVKELTAKRGEPRVATRVRWYSLAGRKRAAFVSLSALARKIGKPEVVVISDRGKRLAGKSPRKASR